MSHQEGDDKAHRQGERCGQDRPFLAAGFLEDREQGRAARIMDEAEEHHVDRCEQRPTAGLQYPECRLIGFEFEHDAGANGIYAGKQYREHENRWDDDFVRRYGHDVGDQYDPVESQEQANRIQDVD